MYEFTDVPVFKLHAGPKRTLPNYTQVINLDEFEYYLWVDVPTDIYRNKFVLSDIFEVGERITPVCILQFVQIFNNIWYKIDSRGLNKSIGQHVYCMKMVNTLSNNVVSVFFSYIIQSDRPDRPYIYIDGSDGCACCCLDNGEQ